MRSKVIYCFVLVLFLIKINAQTVQGNVYNLTGEPLSNCNVSVKNNNDNSAVLSYTTANDEGEFSLDISQIVWTYKLQEIVLEISKIGYVRQRQILNLDVLDILDLKYTLEDSKIDLETIVINAKPKPITHSNDTIIYKSDTFKDGSERTVEDLLKNLPGIDVDEDGKIRFKGNSVGHVLLDGDDMFDANYTIGTKNINVDILEEVHVLEKWSKNHLLKEIEDTEEIAINLKLKDGKTSFSGFGKLGYGIKDRYDAHVNTLTVTKKQKNYSILSYNNTGDNHSPYDFLMNSSVLDNLENESFITPKLIDEQNFSGIFKSQRQRLNKNWFTSTNEIIKASEKVNIRFNFNFYQDKLRYNKFSTHQYRLDDYANFNTSEKTIAIKKPALYNADLELQLKSSENSLLVFNSKWIDESMNTDNNIIINNQEYVFGGLRSKNYFTKQSMAFTQRLSPRKALEIRLIYANHSAPQTYKITPALDFENNSILDNNYTIQQISNKNNHMLLLGDLLGKISKNKVYKLGVGASIKQDNISSYLFSNYLNYTQDYENNLKLNTLETYVRGEYKAQWNRLKLQSILSVKHYCLQFKEHIKNIKKPKNHWVISPEIKLSYTLGPNAKLLMTHNYEESPLRLNYLYPNYILTSFRQISKNENNLEFQKRYTAFTGYTINDLYNQFEMLVGLNYNQSQNAILYQNFITPILTQLNTVVLPEKSETYGAVFNIQKFMPFVSSTLKFQTNYTKTNYKNIVNNSALRDNISDIINAELFYKTAFNFPMNFQNIFNYYNTRSKTKGSPQKISFSSIHNDFKLFFKPNKTWFSSISLEYYKPNLKKDNTYLFLDLDLRYQPENTAWSLSLQGKNLTGNKTYNNYSVNDYSENLSRQGLNVRYIMLKLDFRF